MDCILLYAATSHVFFFFSKFPDETILRRLLNSYGARVACSLDSGSRVRGTRAPATSSLFQYSKHMCHAAQAGTVRAFAATNMGLRVQLLCESVIAVILLNSGSADTAFGGFPMLPVVGHT